MVLIFATALCDGDPLTVLGPVEPVERLYVLLYNIIFSPAVE